ncbi:hypothetical protein RIF29_15423 [Crotalaria pallida]|uniref:Uncharacterized protein n=1 Tax=Crotalaria pallida TaxID=3830 RepID=A0AAN9FLS3_CROPI
MVEIAQEFNIKLIYYSVFSAVALAFFGPHGATKLSPESLAVPPEWVTSSSSTAYQRHKAITFHADAYQENASRISRGKSDCELRKEQVFEIAYGLEVSELPFIWALRKPSWVLGDKCLAIKVKRNENGSFNRNGIAKSLRQAATLEEGEKLRINTREAAARTFEAALHSKIYPFS